ncbi:MAG: ATP-binding cassette domain-containing protein [Clostridiales bacterium]|nr:ATP-binding cassette domain-containing protein [Clostridiales bacterium]
MTEDVLVHAQGLTKEFSSRGSTVYAVSDVTLDIRRGETLALVGESGCGKSTLGRLILCLLKPTSGSVFFDGTETTALDRRKLREFRRHMQLVFQDPYSSLDPRMRVKDLIAEPLRAYGISEQEQTAIVTDLVRRVGLRPDAMERFPHEFSGGQRQRIGIARAVALRPELVVCDEPVSALDVSVQAQILNLLKELQQENGLTYLFISHDLSVVRNLADRVCVMYLGRICELGTTDEIFFHSRHPYTRFLLRAIPRLDPDAKNEDEILAGDPPSPADPPSGCRFRLRCPYAREKCAAEVPKLQGNGEHQCACHFPLEGE